MKVNPELRKLRHQLFIPIKNNKTRVQLSAATISWWICNTIMEALAVLSDSIDLPKSVKAREVCTVVTSGQLFSKMDNAVYTETRQMAGWENLYVVLPPRPLSPSGWALQGWTCVRWWEDCYSHHVLLGECFHPVLGVFLDFFPSFSSEKFWGASWGPRLMLLVLLRAIAWAAWLLDQFEGGLPSMSVSFW